MPRRNDPCPCGSGKKFKKCCLAKTRQEFVPLAMPTSVSSRPTPSAVGLGRSAPTERMPPAPPPDPRIQAMNDHWKQFETASLERQVIMYKETLADPEMCDDELIFEMLTRLRDGFVEAKQPGCLDELIAELRDGQPDLYKASCQYYLEWLIKGALDDGHAELAPLCREMASLADKDIDALNRVLERLEYHGHLPLLVEMARRAWPDVKTSENIVSWGVPEFARRACYYEVFAYLEASPAPSGEDTDLINRFRYFVDKPRRKLLVEHVRHLAGLATQHWTLADFAMSPLPPHRDEAYEDYEEEEDALEDVDAGTSDGVDEGEHDDEDDEPVADAGRRNLLLLSDEFVHFLHTREGVPFTRAEMARCHMLTYLFNRFDGKLKYREAPLDQMMRGNKPKPVHKPTKPLHPLCPEHETFDRYLAGLLGFLAHREHAAAAVFTLTPAWLRFLEANALLEPALASLILKNLEPLVAPLNGLYARAEPVLRKALDEAWPLNAG